jgi:hypothetical protein
LAPFSFDYKQPILNDYAKLDSDYKLKILLRLFIINVLNINNRGKNWNIYNKKGAENKKGEKIIGTLFLQL